MSGVRVPPPASLVSRVAEQLRSTRLRVVLGALSFLAIFLMIAAFVLRPSPVLGMDSEALQHSVGGFLGGGHCEDLGGGTWRCSRQEGGLFADETIGYLVKVNGLGCWRANRTGVPGEGPKRLSGCVTIVDFIFG